MSQKLSILSITDLSIIFSGIICLIQFVYVYFAQIDCSLRRHCVGGWIRFALLPGCLGKITWTHLPPAFSFIKMGYLHERIVGRNERICVESSWHTVSSLWYLGFLPIFACFVSHGSLLLFNILCSIYMFSLSLLNCKANYLRKGTFVFSISQLSAYGKCELSSLKVCMCHELKKPFSSNVSRQESLLVLELSELWTNWDFCGIFPVILSCIMFFYPVQDSSLFLLMQHFQRVSDIDNFSLSVTLSLGISSSSHFSNYWLTTYLFILLLMALLGLER